MYMWWKSRDKIDDELDLYEKGRKLRIDEELSEWRRSQKNRATDDVIAYTEEVRRHKLTIVGEIKDQQLQLSLIEQRIVQAQSDYESRAQLRERTSKVEREKFEAVLAEKNTYIKHLEGENANLVKESEGILLKLTEALGTAAGKENVTKVVGFGPS